MYTQRPHTPLSCSVTSTRVDFVSIMHTSTKVNSQRQTWSMTVCLFLLVCLWACFSSLWVLSPVEADAIIALPRRLISSTYFRSAKNFGYAKLFTCPSSNLASSWNLPMHKSPDSIMCHLSFQEGGYHLLLVGTTLGTRHAMPVAHQASVKMCSKLHTAQSPSTSTYSGSVRQARTGAPFSEHFQTQQRLLCMHFQVAQLLPLQVRCICK